MILLMAGIGAAAAILLVGGRAIKGSAPMPAENTAAPDFTLNSQEHHPIHLRDLRGRWVVLYFYPKDFTGGCTIEARNFQRDLTEYEKRSTVILGLSTQDEKTHEAFCAKQGLNFKLLADTRGIVSKQYGSLVNLGVTKLSARRTFLLDPQGTIRKVWPSVNFERHSAEVLATLDELQKVG